MALCHVKWLPGGAKSKNRMWYQLQMSSCITLLHLFLNFRRWIYYCFWYLWSSIFSLSLLFKTKLYALKFCNSRKNIFGIEYFRTRKKAELCVFWNGYTVASYSNENLSFKWELSTCPILSLQSLFFRWKERGMMGSSHLNRTLQ